MKKWIDKLSIEIIGNLITTFKDKCKAISIAKKEICVVSLIKNFRYEEKNSECINLYNNACSIDLRIKNEDYIFIYDENNISVKISDYVALEITDIEYDEFIKQYETIKMMDKVIELNKNCEEEVKFKITKYEEYQALTYEGKREKPKAKVYFVEPDVSTEIIEELICENQHIEFDEENALIKIKGLKYANTQFGKCYVDKEEENYFGFNLNRTHYDIISDRTLYHIIEYVNETAGSIERYIKVKNGFSIFIENSTLILHDIEAYKKEKREEELERQRIENEYWSGLSDIEEENLINMYEK